MKIFSRIIVIAICALTLQLSLLFKLSKKKAQCALSLFANENGDCVDTCPDGTMADNMTRKCLKPDEKPKYYKAFSLGKCMNTCGIGQVDCTCENGCAQQGTCCSDYELCDYIFNKLPKHDTNLDNCLYSTPDDQHCFQCKSGYYLSKGGEGCVENCPSGTTAISSNMVCIDTHCILY